MPAVRKKLRKCAVIGGCGSSFGSGRSRVRVVVVAGVALENNGKVVVNVKVAVVQCC
jgi:hypothetical protein